MFRVRPTAYKIRPGFGLETVPRFAIVHELLDFVTRPECLLVEKIRPTRLETVPTVVIISLKVGGKFGVRVRRTELGSDPNIEVVVVLGNKGAAPN